MLAISWSRLSHLLSATVAGLRRRSSSSLQSGRVQSVSAQSLQRAQFLQRRRVQNVFDFAVGRHLLHVVAAATARGPRSLKHTHMCAHDYTGWPNLK